MTFDFFGLSPELRNTVYSNLARQKSTLVPVTHAGWIVKVSEYIEPKLVLVNKQFKEEYEEEVSRRAQLCSLANIGDNRVHNSPLDLEYLGNTLRLVRHFRFDFCNGDIDEFNALCEGKPGTLPRRQPAAQATFGMNILTSANSFKSKPSDNPKGESGEDLFSAIEKARFSIAKSNPGCAAYAGLYVMSDLYSPLLTGPLRNIDEERRHEFEAAVARMPKNLVTWSASASPKGDPHSFHGFHLMQAACGSFDAEAYDALVAQALVVSENTAEDEVDA